MCSLLDLGQIPPDFRTFWKVSCISQYICCKNGYSNIITSIPYIAIYSPNPEAINSCYIQSSLNYKPSNKTILETLSFAYEQKLDAFKSQSSVEFKHPYFNYASKRNL